MSSAQSIATVPEILSFLQTLGAGGGKFTDQKFAEALGWKGMYGAARAAVNDLEFYDVLTREDQLRVLKDLGWQYCKNPTQEAIRRIASAPASFRKYWKQILAGGANAITTISPEEMEAFKSASFVCGFFRTDNSWDMDALTLAVSEDFSFTERAVPSEFEFSRDDLGLTIKFLLPAVPKFPERTLTATLLHACDDFEATVLRASGYEISFGKELNESQQRKAFAYIKGVWLDAKA